MVYENTSLTPENPYKNTPRKKSATASYFFANILHQTPTILWAEAGNKSTQGKLGYLWTSQFNTIRLANWPGNTAHWQFTWIKMATRKKGEPVTTTTTTTKILPSVCKRLMEIWITEENEKLKIKASPRIVPLSWRLYSYLIQTGFDWGQCVFKYRNKASTLHLYSAV